MNFYNKKNSFSKPSVDKSDLIEDTVLLIDIGEEIKKQRPELSKEVVQKAIIYVYHKYMDTYLSIKDRKEQIIKETIKKLDREN